MSEAERELLLIVANELIDFNNHNYHTLVGGRKQATETIVRIESAVAKMIAAPPSPETDTGEPDAKV